LLDAEHFQVLLWNEPTLVGRGGEPSVNA